MSVPIPQSVMDDLEEVCRFFGIDLEWNRQLFSETARDTGGAFNQVITRLSVAVREDKRNGLNRRLRKAWAEEAAKRKQAPRQFGRR